MDKNIHLYQMAISHYCEKVRWALDWKSIPFTVHTLLPGPHVPIVRKLTQSRSSSLPVIRHQNQVLQNSADILDYLDRHFPESSLIPVDIDESAVREWELFADTRIGPHVRRCCYHILLNHKALVVPMLAHDGPWYGGSLLRLIFPRLVKVMRHSMFIDQQGYMQSKVTLDEAIEHLRQHLRGRQFLVGESFTRADLAVAALLAPLARPAGYGIDWPLVLPKELEAIAIEYTDVLAWVKTIYDNHRMQRP